MSRKTSDFSNNNQNKDDEPNNTSNQLRNVMNSQQQSFATNEQDTNVSPPSTSTNSIITANTFDEMNLKDLVLRGLYAAGFDTPAPCQRIIPSLTGNDIRDAIISAQAGSGKTLLYSVVALNGIDNTILRPQAIVLAPTRELALQIFNVMCSIGDFSGVSIALHRGVGMKTKKDSNIGITSKANVKSETYMTFGTAKEGCEQIIVATPGRLLDIITNEKGIRINPMKTIPKLNMSYIRNFIMDEADELLSPHNEFQDTIANIFSNIPTIEYCQKLIVSATITPSVIEICNQILNNPLQILIKKEDVPLSSVKQYYVSLEQEEHKAACLLDIYKNVSISTSMIFTNKIEKAEYINDIMKEQGYQVGFIHAKLSQSDRDSIIADFRKGKIRVLVTTDLLSRGFDVPSVSVVFNYDLPNTMENYIHRVGRAGRFGRVGVAVNLMVEAYSAKPKDIVALEKHYNIEIKVLPGLEVLSIGR
jgi:superfamily II DNA/RNA helicase